MRSVTAPFGPLRVIWAPLKSRPWIATGAPLTCLVPVNRLPDRVTPLSCHPLSCQPLSCQPLSCQPLSCQPLSCQPLTAAELSVSPLSPPERAVTSPPNSTSSLSHAPA